MRANSHSCDRDAREEVLRAAEDNPEVFANKDDEEEERTVRAFARLAILIRGLGQEGVKSRVKERISQSAGFLEVV